MYSHELLGERGAAIGFDAFSFQILFLSLLIICIFFPVKTQIDRAILPEQSDVE